MRCLRLYVCCCCSFTAASFVLNVCRSGHSGCSCAGDTGTDVLILLPISSWDGENPWASGPVGQQCLVKVSLFLQEGLDRTHGPFCLHVATRITGTACHVGEILVLCELNSMHENWGPLSVTNTSGQPCLANTALNLAIVCFAEVLGSVQTSI